MSISLEKGNAMKQSKLLSILLASAFAVGCTGMMGNQSGDQASSQRSAGEVIDDTTITTKVKSALLADPEISGLKINVDTVQGKVSLKGEVKTLALRKKAESIAKGVAGVRSVNNQLVVTG
jgi:hyperosmotically inducible protein